MRRREGIGQGLIFSDGPGCDIAGVLQNVFRLAIRDWQAHEMVAAVFLHSEVDGVAIGLPLRRALSIVDSRADLAAVRTVGIHDPYVGVLHGGFAVGETATGAPIDDELAVRRP